MALYKLVSLLASLLLLPAHPTPSHPRFPAFPWGAHLPFPGGGGAQAALENMVVQTAAASAILLNTGSLTDKFLVDSREGNQA